MYESNHFIFVSQISLQNEEFPIARVLDLVECKEKSNNCFTTMKMKEGNPKMIRALVNQRVIGPYGDREL